MSLQIQAYLFFDGRCAEAIEFYRQALGAKVEMLVHFKDAPASAPTMGRAGDKVMHGRLRIGETQILVSDGSADGQPRFAGFSLFLSVPDAATADRHFAALAEGGKVQMPLGQTFFSPRFGMVEDRFGVGWMVGVFTEADHLRS